MVFFIDLTAAVNFRFEHHAVIQDIIAVEQSLQRGIKLITGFHFREEAHMTRIDAENRHRKTSGLTGNGQQCSVSAQHDETVAVPSVTAQKLPQKNLIDHIIFPIRYDHFRSLFTESGNDIPFHGRIRAFIVSKNPDLFHQIPSSVT